MATNVGNLSLILTARYNNAEMKTAIQDTKILASAAEETQVKMRNLGSTATPTGGGGGAARAAQQLGFGLQDFSSQIMNSKNGIDGIGRGIMAVSNNVAMLGAAFGPVGMAVTSIGAAVAGILIPKAIEWYTNTEKQEQELKKVNDRYMEIRATIRDAITDAENLTKAMIGRGENPADARRILQQDVDRKNAFARDARQQLAIAEAEKKRLDAEATRVAGRSATGVQGAGAIVGNTMAGNLEALLLPKELRDRMDANKKKLESAKQFNDDMRVEAEAAARAMTEGLRLIEDKENKDKWKKAQDAQKAELKYKEEKDKEYHKQRRAFAIEAAKEEENDIRTQMDENSKQQQALRDAGLNPNGSSAASVRGTGAAASAINRAISGTRSEEATNQKQLKELEKIRQVLQDQLKQAGLRKASLPA